jgi:hypothetical protein
VAGLAATIKLPVGKINSLLPEVRSANWKTRANQTRSMSAIISASMAFLFVGRDLAGIESPSSAAICKCIWIGSLGDRELMAHDIGAGRALFRRR